MISSFWVEGASTEMFIGFFTGFYRIFCFTRFFSTRFIGESFRKLNRRKQDCARRQAQAQGS